MSEYAELLAQARKWARDGIIGPLIHRLADAIEALVRERERDQECLTLAIKTARDQIAATERELADARAALLDATASLAAAVSLLERTPAAKRAAPSNKMFDQMLKDYQGALVRARAALPNGGRDE